jgi:hypothetical protein
MALVRKEGIINVIVYRSESDIDKQADCVQWIADNQASYPDYTLQLVEFPAEGDWCVFYEKTKDPEITPAAQWDFIKVQVIEYMDAQLQAMAEAYDYQSIHTMISYLDSTIEKWQTEAELARDYRDLLMSTAYQLLWEYQQSGVIPTLEEVVAQLPPFPPPPVGQAEGDVNES